MTYKDLHPYRGDGTAVDATFDVEAIPLFEIVYHHKAGGRGNPRAVNSDYHEGLELLLGRLALGGATILGISVDSSVALRLPPDERELDLPFPLQVDASTVIHELRLDITRAQKAIARRADALAAGGNDQKRIRITLKPHDGIGSDSFVRLLTAPVPYRKSSGSLEVWILQSEDGEFRGRWHSRYYTTCPGRAALARQHPDATYVLVPRSVIGADVLQCRFCERFDVSQLNEGGSSGT